MWMRSDLSTGTQFWIRFAPRTGVYWRSTGGRCIPRSCAVCILLCLRSQVAATHREIAGVAERQGKFKKQRAADESQVIAFEHGLATAKVVPPPDVQVFDESFEGAPSPHVVVVITRDPVSVTILLEVVDRLVCEMGLEVNASSRCKKIH